MLQFFITYTTELGIPGGLPYTSEGNARRKIKIKPLKETSVGVAQAQLSPKAKGDFCVVSVTAFFVNFFMHSPM